MMVRSIVGPGGKCLCQAPADPGKDGGANRQHHQRCRQAVGCWRNRQVKTSLHDHPRRTQARYGPDYQPHAGLLPRHALTRQEFLSMGDLI
jgi:hypothetical protein